MEEKDKDESSDTLRTDDRANNMQCSLLNDANSDDDLRPEQLSGDENSEKSLLASHYIGGKASTRALI
jgi:hypothetical protein